MGGLARLFLGEIQYFRLCRSNGSFSFFLICTHDMTLFSRISSEGLGFLFAVGTGYTVERFRLIESNANSHYLTPVKTIFRVWCLCS